MVFLNQQKKYGFYSEKKKNSTKVYYQGIYIYQLFLPNVWWIFLWKLMINVSLDLRKVQ